MKKVRMLVDREIDGVKYKPNQVVIFSDDLAKPLVQGGEADASKGAVDYAEKELGAVAIEHQPAADAAANEVVDQLEAELADLSKRHRREKDADKKADLARRVAEAKAKLEALQSAPEAGK